MRTVFWNASERRLRAFWRILLQAVLLLVVILAANAALGPLRGRLAAQGLATLVGFVGSVLLAARWLDHRAPGELGVRLDGRWWLDLAFGLSLGMLLMAAIFGVELAAGWIEITGAFAPVEDGRFLIPFLSGIVLFVCVGISEELWVRGYLIPNLAEGLNGRWIGPRAAVVTALVVTSVIFGLLHLPNPNASMMSTIGIVMAGLVLGLPFVWTGSLAIPIGLHITWNAFQGLIFGFPVSGTTDFPSVVALDQGGPQTWTGGAFGPEAGLVSVVALLVGIWLIRVWVVRVHGAPLVDPSIATPPRDVQFFALERQADAVPAEDEA